MPSIVDMIAQTENEAEAIRAAAGAKAKELIANANDECAEAERTKNAEMKRLYVLRRESAETSAKRLTNEIISKREVESRENANHAEKNVDKAVKLIIERVTRL